MNPFTLSLGLDQLSEIGPMTVAFDRSLTIRYLGPGWDTVHVRGVPFNTGDGFRMAMDIGALPHGSWSTCHASPQDIALLDARKGLKMFEKVKLPNPQRILDAYPHQLSGGQKQRVMIAMAMSCNPSILIADEPTGNLDPATSVGIMKLLDRINREGTTVLMATHDSGIVDQMRKRVIELDRGHVIRDQVRGVYGYTG